MVVALAVFELADQHPSIFKHCPASTFGDGSVPLSAVAAVRLSQSVELGSEFETGVAGVGSYCQEGVVIGDEQILVRGVGLGREGVHLLRAEGQVSGGDGKIGIYLLSLVAAGLIAHYLQLILTWK